MGDTRIGIIYPGDGALDREFWDFAPPGVSLHFTRQPLCSAHVGLESMSGLVDDGTLEPCADSLKIIAPAAIGFACTSASFIRGLAGEAAIRRQITEVSGSPATTTSGGILAGCRALGLKQVAVAAPYVEEVSVRLGSFLEEGGIGVSQVRHMGLEEGIAEVSAEEVVRVGMETDTPDAEGLVISCTNLATLEAIPILEERLGKPVVSANQATVWHSCVLASVPWAEGFGVGRLWRANRPAAVVAAE
jgi:maleate isomerase